MKILILKFSNVPSERTTERFSKIYIARLGYISYG